jgi:rhodanese-related sulfurtransferase
MKVKIVLLSVFLIGFISCIKPKTDESFLASPATFEKLLQDENAQLVDVRTPEEYAEGHLKNALNIPISFDNFESQLEILDKNKPVLVYCRMGGRSAKAAAKLKELGFTTISDLDGGITSWEKEGNPTEVDLK